jgi:hypothetical protein
VHHASVVRMIATMSKWNLFICFFFRDCHQFVCLLQTRRSPANRNGGP